MIVDTQDLSPAFQRVIAPCFEFPATPLGLIKHLPFADYQALPGVNASALKENTTVEMAAKLVGAALLPSVERALIELQDEGVNMVMEYFKDQMPRMVPRNFVKAKDIPPIDGKLSDAQREMLSRIAVQPVDAREFHGSTVAGALKKGWAEYEVREVEEVGASDSVRDSRAQSLAIGDALHKSILEPHYFDTDSWQKHWQLCPTKSLVSEAALAAARAEPTRALITPEIIDVARRARDAVRRHKEADRTLSLPGSPEVTGLAWDEETLTLRKVRIDYLPDDPAEGIVDLKTTRVKLVKEAVKSQVYKLGYDLQLAYYTDTLELIERKRRGPKLIIAVTNFSPFQARIFHLEEVLEEVSFIARGRDIYQERLAALRLAFHENNYEAYENEGRVSLIR